MPKVSIVIPTCSMGGKEIFLLIRCLESIHKQTFKDFEIIITDNSMSDNVKKLCKKYTAKYYSCPVIGASANTNNGIRLAKGEIIKILHMDDFFAHNDALKNIVDNFKGGWLVTGCNHLEDNITQNDHYATFTSIIYEINTIGSPSVLTIENKEPLLFNEDLVWMFDCDYYKRLSERYGEPTVLDDISVTIGLGEHQATNKISDDRKKEEEELVIKMYEQLC